jgi:hypothetical protein
MKAAKISFAEGGERVHASALEVGSAGDPRVSSSILKAPASPCAVVPNFATNTTPSDRPETSDASAEYIPYKKTVRQQTLAFSRNGFVTCGKN